MSLLPRQEGPAGQEVQHLHEFVVVERFGRREPFRLWRGLPFRPQAEGAGDIAAQLL